MGKPKVRRTGESLDSTYFNLGKMKEMRSRAQMVQLAVHRSKVEFFHSNRVTDRNYRFIDIVVAL